IAWSQKHLQLFGLPCGETIFRIVERLIFIPRRPARQQTSPGDHMPGQDGAAVITVVQPTVPKADTISKNMGKKRPFEKGP
ncbi:MAG: hypothetical protein WAQ10_05980, partial [Dethiobacteria bacterium]